MRRRRLQDVVCATLPSTTYEQERREPGEFREWWELALWAESDAIKEGLRRVLWNSSENEFLTQHPNQFSVTRGTRTRDR